MALMLTRLDVRGAGGDLAARLPRPSADDVVPVGAVRQILAGVRQRGDAAVRELTERFDGVAVDRLEVDRRDIARALASMPSALRDALEVAAINIEAFAKAEAAPSVHWDDGGLTVRTLRRPVDRAGCYVPGGRAVYPSTVLMTALPARVAGVREVVVCSPPAGDGRVPETVLAAAAIAGVDAVYRIGGAQAIAAMAYGCESLAPVDVIVGPGSVIVAAAKREVAAEGRVGVPAAFTGPSEVVVVADESTGADLAAIDLVVQAEHGPGGLAWLVTWSEETAAAVEDAVDRMVAAAPRRSEIESTLAGGGYSVVVEGPAQAMEVANLIAPEHLQLMTAEPDSLLPLVRHAGAVFLGPWAPASLGDYVAGPSHVLPTFGSARFAGGLTVDDFTKPVHVITADRTAFDRLAPHVEALASAEGLDAHAESVRLRRKAGE